MLNAGYADSPYKIIVQTYSSPIPNGSRLPLLAVGLHAAVDRRLRLLEQRRRLGEQHRGADDQQLGEERRRADRARELRVLDRPERARRAPAVREHGRAARGEGRGELDSRRRGRQDRVGQPGPHRRRRSSVRTSSRRTRHPSYWGQLALRNCLRQAYNGGAAGGRDDDVRARQRPQRLVGAEHGAAVTQAAASTAPPAHSTASP